MDFATICVSLGFEPPEVIAGRASIAHLVRASRRCGIYAFRFETGECYVGQSLDVAARYVQHRQRHRDIESFSFRSTAKRQLGEAEAETIARFEQAGFRLRNISLVSQPPIGGDFDQLFSRGWQHLWYLNPRYAARHSSRPLDLDQRHRFADRWNRYRCMASARALAAGLRAYVRQTIPDPAFTEATFWSVSLFPGTNDGRVVFRVNVYWQEVFVAAADDLGCYFRFAVAPSHLPGRHAYRDGDTIDRWSALSYFDLRYDSGGRDQAFVSTPSVFALRDALHSNELGRSARRFVLRLMQKGTITRHRSRSHCPQAADLALSDTPFSALATCFPREVA